jgi:hypothetical protein
MFVASGWKDDQLHMLKDELKSLMRSLDTYNLHNWHKHTSSLNKAGDIKHRLRFLLDPGLLTGDWCKFYEIAMYFNLIPFPKPLHEGTQF